MDLVSTNVTVIYFMMTMCMQGVMDADKKCPDGSPPFEASMSILNGVAAKDCTPKLQSENWRDCVAKWTSIIEIDRNGSPLFIMYPDGDTKSFYGFSPNEAAMEFWRGIKQYAPNLGK